MGKFILTNVKVVVNGSDFSGHAFNVDTPQTKEQIDVSGFNATKSREFLPGQEDDSLVVQFLQDFSTVHPVLYPLFSSGSAFSVWVMPDATAAGTAGTASATNPIYGGSATLYEYNGLSGALNARAEMTCTFKPAPNSVFSWATAGTAS